MRSAEQRPHLGQNLGYHWSRGPTCEARVPRPPVEAPDLVRQHNTRDRTIRRERDFKCVPSDP